MKIAVVGCGAVGSFYGAKLCRAGQDVHFLLRSDYEVVEAQGIAIESPRGNFHVRPRAANAPEAIGISDLVLIGLKTTANGQLPRLLPPLVGPRTAVLTLQNGLGNEEQLARLVPADQILGGLCFVCLNRVAPGLIRHTDHGNIVLGEFQRRPRVRTREIAALFCQASVPCEVTDDLARTHWEKLTWNIPFNGLGVAGTAGYDAVIQGELAPCQPLGPVVPTDRLLDGGRWEALLRDLIREVIAAAHGVGFSIPDSLVDKQMVRTRTMGAYKASTLLDFERGQPLELESMFLEPLRRATQAGVSTPRLSALCSLLAQLEEQTRASATPSGTCPAKG
jgi:2-dehydropantoate 2-reductase